MKIYTEVNYTWDDEKNELVKESEKSFDYEGELVQCIKIGGYSFKNPLTQPISYGGSTTPNIPIPNIPTPAGSFEDIPGGISLLTNNVGYVAKGIVGGKDEGGIMGNLDRLAKAGKEALTGQGGYVDDEPGEPPGPGPTGFEAASAQKTLLTGQRVAGAGRGLHAKKGSAQSIR